LASSMSTVEKSAFRETVTTIMLMAAITLSFKYNANDSYQSGRRTFGSHPVIRGLSKFLFTSIIWGGE